MDTKQIVEIGYDKTSMKWIVENGMIKYTSWDAVIYLNGVKITKEKLCKLQNK